MAQKQQVIVTSDLSGDSDADSVTFALDGTNYEIDLTNAEADEFRSAMSKYVDVARKSGSTGGARRRSSAGSAAPRGKSDVDLNLVRQWARDEKGYTVSDRGRVKQSIIEEYKAANPS